MFQILVIIMVQHAFKQLLYFPPFVFLQHAVTPRCRVRNQVGCTNRWRLPESLGSDLLGTAQAVKAIRVPYNSTLISIITGIESTRDIHTEHTPGRARPEIKTC